MACGRIDLEVMNRAFWRQAFGGQMSDEAYLEMHPLRRAERPPPTPEAVKASAEMGWAILGKGLAALNAQRKG